MEDHREVVVLSAVRTPIGKYGGGLASVPPRGLAAAVVREAVSRAAVAPADIGHAVFGQVIHTEVRDMYLSRVAAVNWGLPVETPAFTLNRLCGGRTLVRVHPDDHLAHLQSLLLDHAVIAEPGGHRYFELGKPLLSLSPLTAAPGPRRPDESHTTSAGSRNESDEPGTWTEPRQAPVLRQVNK